MPFTIMAALGQMKNEIKRERVIDSIAKHRNAGKNLGGRPRIISERQRRNACSLIDSGEPAAEVARNLSMSSATFYQRVLTVGPLPDQEAHCT